MPRITQDEIPKILKFKDHTEKEQKQVKELLKLEFEIIAVSGLIIGILQLDFSELDKSIMPGIYAIIVYHLSLLLLLIIPILIFYIGDIKISKRIIDLGYKLIFIQIIITIFMLIGLLIFSPGWNYIFVDVVVIFIMILSIIIIMLSWNLKRKKLIMKKYYEKVTKESDSE